MEMRECDVELFEDNPEEFIRRDLEGSDVDTRRRAAPGGRPRARGAWLLVLVGTRHACMWQRDDR